MLSKKPFRNGFSDPAALCPVAGGLPSLRAGLAERHVDGKELSEVT
jgi:hypothetical protein